MRADWIGHKHLMAYVSFFVMVLLLSYVVLIGFAAFPSSYTLGIKPGDWMEYSYTSGTHSEDLFARFEVISVEGPPRLSVTMKKDYYVNWPNYKDETSSGDFPTIPQNYENWVIGMLIPANSKVGDTIITGAPGNLDRNHDGTAVILDEITGNFAGESRTALHVSYSVCNTHFDHYYDKQTGFLVQETRTTYLLGTETVKAVRTNLWGHNTGPNSESSKWAVVIGVEDYDSGVTSAAGPAQSAKEIYDILVNSFGYQKTHINNNEGVLVDELYNPLRRHITSMKIFSMLSWLKSVAGPEDT
ncbi:MAG: hypothetical protein QXX08_11120, partial [Candidatus Bathyarchaeia archaeon]